MLDTLALSIFIGIIFLWAPSFLILKAARINTLTTLSISPIVSLAIYWILGELYRKIGIFSDWVSVFIPPLIIGMIACLISFIIFRKRDNAPNFLSVPGVNNNDKRGFILFGTYITAGMVITSIVFLGNIGSALDFLAEYDSVHHLGATAAFADTGIWSSFTASSDLSLDESIRPYPLDGFYPTLWHTFTAMLISCLDIPVTLATNATNFLLTAAIFPASMFFLLRILFRDNFTSIITGSVVVFAFIAFPWKFLIWGPLFPNLMSMVLLPAVCGIFLLLFEPNKSRSAWITTILLFLIGVLTLIFSQTNAIFTMGVFVAPFIVWQVSKIPIRKSDSSSTTGQRIVYTLIAILAIGVIWIAFYKSPFLKAVVSHVWPAFTSIPRAIFNVLTLSFRETEPQYVLGTLTLIGIISTLKNRKYLWITCSYLIMVVIYIICATTEGSLKHLTGGFWYTDPMRLGAAAALFAMPIVCIGFSTITKGIQLLVYKISSSHEKKHIRGSHVNISDERAANSPNQRLATYISVGVNVCLLCLVFFPLGSLLGIDKYTPAFSYLTNTFKNIYSPVETIETGYRNDTLPRLYSVEEQEFVEKAKDITGDDLVINQPNDGSGFAFSVSDYDNLYYRSMGGYGVNSENENSKTIREELVNISTNADVVSAVTNLGAKYVLKLDQGDQYLRNNPYLWSYREEDWTGIDEIDDNTPGFEIVLSDNDMRLYKIKD